MSDANANQRTYWNEQAGPMWVTLQQQMDAQLRAHGERALAILGARPGESVLDVGCGCGDTALALARAVGSAGRVLGVDISGPMLSRARERAQAEALTQVTFELADAQLWPFPPGTFDALFSRFGVMFFEAPELAFANLARALKAGGRVVFACWQPLAANPWAAVPVAAVASVVPVPPPEPNAPGPFAFADTERVGQILAAAGFTSVAFRSEYVSMKLGGVEEAATFLTDMGPASRAIREAGGGEALRERARAAIATALAPHVRDGAVELGSAIWVVSAVKAA